MNEPDKSGNKGCLGLFYGFIGGFTVEIINILFSVILFVSAYFLIISLFWFIGDESENIEALCIFGLGWLALCIYLFVKSIKASRSFNMRKHQIESELVKENSRFFRIVLETEYFLVKYAGQKTYKLAAISVASAHIFTKLLIETGSGELVTYFDYKNWNIVFVLFVILPFVLGIHSDFKSRFKNEFLDPSWTTKFLYFFGIFEFFRNLIIYITGFFGGKNAFFAIKSIDDLVPFESFDLIITNWYSYNTYKETNSYIVFQELGLLLFSLVFIAIPFIAIFFNKQLEKEKNSVFPEAIIDSIYKTSYLILLIPIYIGWHEGWISEAIVFFRNFLN